MADSKTKENINSNFSSFFDKLKKVSESEKAKKVKAEILESKTINYFKAGENVCVPVGLSYLGDCWKEVAVLDKKDSTLRSTIKKVPVVAVTVAFKNLQGETVTTAVPTEEHFSVGNNYYNIVTAGHDGEIDEDGYIPSLLGKTCVIDSDAKGKKVLAVKKPMDHHFQDNVHPDLSKVSPSLWYYEDDEDAKNVNKLNPYAKSIYENTSVALNPDWDKDPKNLLSRDGLVDMYLSYSSENKEGDFDTVEPQEIRIKHDADKAKNRDKNS